MHILYIEDNSDDAALVNRYITTTEHELTVVSTIDEARSILSNPLDLVLVDVLLDSGREGSAFAHELRSQGYKQPLIAVTALATPTDMRTYSEVGFDDVLTKPFTISQLAQVIDHYA